MQRQYYILCSVIFTIVAIRAAVVPFSHDETATFFYYIQTGEFLPYNAHIDANNHILNSFLAWLCFHLFGDSPFSLRLPNLLGLIILMMAVYRLSARLNHTSSKIILISGLLLSFNWLGFFSVCRGYGISLSLLALAISFIPDYRENNKLSHILKIYVLLNLAVAANLSLIIAVLLITLFICLYQVYHRRFFKMDNMAILIIHIICTVFWVKFSFFLQNSNSLYAGQGDSYWIVTFQSLIVAIVGNQNLLINTSVVTLYLALMAAGFVIIKDRKQSVPFIIFLVILLNTLILGFYMLKKIYGVNYPEDRAGLFFYLLFILNAAFIADRIKPNISNSLSGIIFTVFIIHFLLNINFRKNTLEIYKSFPKRFYDRLVKEQSQHSSKITIGGYPLRELFYAFMNYRHSGELNPMDYSWAMMMNTDYHIGLKKERMQYSPYYSEIDSDADFNFMLLKRKHPLARNLIIATGKKQVNIDKEREYFNLFEYTDTNFRVDTALNPESGFGRSLLVDVIFKVNSGDMPSQLWLVIQVDTGEGKSKYYNRIPLNWVKYNWLNDTKNDELLLTTGPLPNKIHKFICYFWNVKRQQLKVAIDSIKIFRLEETP